MIHLYLLPYNHLQRAAIRLSANNTSCVPVKCLSVFTRTKLIENRTVRKLPDVSDELVRYTDNVRFYAIALLHHTAETSHIICSDLCALRILTAEAVREVTPFSITLL